METKKKKEIHNRFENYTLVPMKDVVSFGTTLFVRNDKRALKIVFPAGQICTFAPLDEIESGNEVVLPPWVYKLSKKKFAELQRAILKL
jgi:hypothetical protein